jgi:hypothetical protein
LRRLRAAEPLAKVTASASRTAQALGVKGCWTFS